jgi:hypothetical protein
MGGEGDLSMRVLDAFDLPSFGMCTPLIGTKGNKKPWDCSLLPVPTVEETSSPVLSYLILNEADLL